MHPCRILTPVAAIMYSAAIGVVSAQPVGDTAPPLPIRQVTLDPVNLSPRPYSDRSVATVYDNLNDAFINGSATHLGTCSQMLEDLNFSSGPWDNQHYPFSRTISEITFGIGLLTTNASTEDVLFIFWDEDDVNFQGISGANSPMIRPNAIPLSVVRFDPVGLTAGFYWQVTSNLTALPGGGVTVPNDDNAIALQVAWVADAFTPPDTNADGRPNWENLANGLFEGCSSTTDRALVFASSSGAPVGGNPATIGTTTPSYGRDISNAAMCANLGTFLGNGGPPAASGNIEHRFLNATPQRGYMIRLRGDVIHDDPGCPTPPIGPLPDTGITVSRTLAPNEATIFCFSLAGAATDTARQFLDIDTEGSIANTSIALWNASGTLLAVNDDDASAFNAQLSFGIGIRPRVGDGTPYNGRHGQLPPGPYYLGVGTGPPGATTFGDAFVRTSTGPGGSVTVRFATNTNGSPLAPSSPPDTVRPPLNAGLPLRAPGERPPTATIAPLSALWYEFRTCTIAAPGAHLDIHTNDTPNPNIDTELFLFNDSGQLLATDDDSGSDFLSQLSFGNPGPRPAPGNGEPYAGQHGTLSAGRYYLAVALFDTAATGTRWHLRSEALASEVVQVAFETDSPGFCPRCHGACVADFDDGTNTGNPDGGVNIDDLLYFLGIFEQGVACADVDDGSNTNTPDGGVTIDDLLYYLFRFEAGC